MQADWALVKQIMIQRTQTIAHRSAQVAVVAAQCLSAETQVRHVQIQVLLAS
jgi:hypothetical protein